MNRDDIIEHFLFEDIPIRGQIVHLHESYQAIIKQHNYPPFLQQLLGEALAIVTLLSGMIKMKGRLTLQFQGKGKLKLLLAQCTDEQHVRGLIQCQDDFEESDLSDSLLDGTLAIMIHPDKEGSKQYQGIVTAAGTLSQSIEHYFKHSEQLGTRLWLSVNETHAAGLMLQITPQDNPDTHQNDWDHITHLTDTITPHELLSLESQTLLHRLYSEENIRLFEKKPVIFQCTCSQRRSEQAILLLGIEEAEKELLHKQHIVVTCDFCNKDYLFDRISVLNLFKKDTPPSIH